MHRQVPADSGLKMIDAIGISGAIAIQQPTKMPRMDSILSTMRLAVGHPTNEQI
jgi:hypothetical protein